MARTAYPKHGIAHQWLANTSGPTRTDEISLLDYAAHNSAPNDLPLQLHYLPNISSNTIKTRRAWTQDCINRTGVKTYRKHSVNRIVAVRIEFCCAQHKKQGLSNNSSAWVALINQALAKFPH